jgi:hypothetical protein
VGPEIREAKVRAKVMNGLACELMYKCNFS